MAPGPSRHDRLKQTNYIWLSLVILAEWRGLSVVQHMLASHVLHADGAARHGSHACHVAAGRPRHRPPLLAQIRSHGSYSNVAAQQLAGPHELWAISQAIFI